MAAMVEYLGIQLMSGATAGYSPGRVNTAGNPAAYAEFISRGYFSIIALNSGATPALDNDIEVDLARTPGYHIIGWSSYSGAVHPIWAYKDTHDRRNSRRLSATAGQASTQQRSFRCRQTIWRKFPMSTGTGCT